MEQKEPCALTGLILRSQGGFYQVRTSAGELRCRGRGRFRKEATQLLVGDQVEVQPTEEGAGFITGLAPRKNFLIRPPVANLDRLVLVVSAADPAPNLLVVDKLTAIAARRGIPAALVFTKPDLADTANLAAIYRGAGYPVCQVNSLTGEGIPQVRALFQGGLSAFCGNSGAGKSTLLNALYPELQLATGEISRKLGRGRHTTRHVELFPTGDGGYIADTPGFSAVEFLQFEKMPAAALENCFPEFGPYREKCRFTGCSHRVEKGCAVLAAVEEGKIPESRHQSYRAIYEELRGVKEWELK
ncbi:MAG: ribosome small subunit-dependent GTPase A [Angelakisella sp.]|nr:ribosome small subunit-dependent GTPase A [Angelakisella sp.]